MQRFVLTSRGSFNVDDILNRFPFLSNYKNVSMIKNDESSPYRILPHKYLLVIDMDKVEEIAEMAMHIPTVEFKINYLMFPRIGLD
jgi:hypothetical protein